MACLIKVPESTKGVLVFTSPEIKFLSKKVKIMEKLGEKYIIGIHYNWQPIEDQPPDYVSFLFANELDLSPNLKLNNKLILNIDACNFVPDDFNFINPIKYWDSISIFRNVAFKNYDIGLNVVRKTYNLIKKIADPNLSLPRILFLVSSPSKNLKNKFKSQKISYKYSKMFDYNEKKFFQLINIYDNYPFPFLSQQLSLFFHSANSFMSFSENEYRSRMVGYAISSGLPVISFPPTSNLFPNDFKTEPYFFSCTNVEDFAKALLNDKLKPYKNPILQKNFDGNFQSINLKRKLVKEYNLDSQAQNWYLDKLDIRLGRHHVFGKNKPSPNHLSLKLEKFINLLYDMKFDKSINEQDIEEKLNF